MNARSAWGDDEFAGPPVTRASTSARPLIDPAPYRPGPSLRMRPRGVRRLGAAAVADVVADACPGGRHHRGREQWQQHLGGRLPLGDTHGRARELQGTERQGGKLAPAHPAAGAAVEAVQVSQAQRFVYAHDGINNLFVVLPKPWMVERIIAWLFRCRRLARDRETRRRNALAFLHPASIRLMPREPCKPAGTFRIRSQFAISTGMPGGSTKRCFVTPPNDAAATLLCVKAAITGSVAFKPPHLP